MGTFPVSGHTEEATPRAEGGVILMKFPDDFSLAQDEHIGLRKSAR
jgi:hypothetical protein